MHVGHLIEIPPSRWVIVTCTTGFSWREAWGQAYCCGSLDARETVKALSGHWGAGPPVHLRTHNNASGVGLYW